MRGEALGIEGLWKAFGANQVLRGIDLSVAAHEVVCLIGASGSGKSTLLRCVNLLERIDEGTIRLDGQVISGPGVNQNLVRRHIGIVFQSFNLFPHMTVERNVTLAPTKVLGLSRAEAAEQARLLLDRFGLAEKRADYPDRLSGGQQQRVAHRPGAGRCGPAPMLLDEVTGQRAGSRAGEAGGARRDPGSWPAVRSGMTDVDRDPRGWGSCARQLREPGLLPRGRADRRASPARPVVQRAFRRADPVRFLRRIVDAGRA